MLRRIVRSLGDGTVLGPAMDAIAAVGPDSFWATLGPIMIGAAGIMLVAFGPVVGLVGFLWVYRRLRWLFWTLVGAIAAGAARIRDGVLSLAGRGTGTGGTGAASSTSETDGG